MMGLKMRESRACSICPTCPPETPLGAQGSDEAMTVTPATTHNAIVKGSVLIAGQGTNVCVFWARYKKNWNLRRIGSKFFTDLSLWIAELETGQHFQTL